MSPFLCFGQNPRILYVFVRQHPLWERYQGQWICGLCVEAMKDEIVKLERLISSERTFY
uniref:Uncharacterized protein n=1 Tax=Nelumbo nucifera TaxID=4432 RepID=A0A822YIQ8_NELNU|nr:TPA_asm: hypothetical protein HUJ06_011268 [Nelumbo nucifera]